jgi:hypothetical protein
MRYYFLLQYKMLNRQIADLGLDPFLGIALSVAAFTGLSTVLFNRMESAAYIYILTAISLVTKFSEAKRNDFLKSCFSDHQYPIIRIVENTLVILPFAVFLAIKLMILHAFLLIAVAAFLALNSFRRKTNFTLPTPFGKKPFECTVGFRNTYFAFVLAYFLAFMSVTADNFNLGIFSLILVFLTCITFYLNPEDEFYVWIFNISPGRFLIKKMCTALFYSTTLTLPANIVLVIFFPGEILVIAGFQVLGYIYMSTVILAKYSVYPNQINLVQMLILALTIWFPPALIAVVPYFCRQSLKHLKIILG